LWQQKYKKKKKEDPKKVGVKEVELVLIANNLIMELVNDDHT
jgi:hypothetical protein